MNITWILIFIVQAITQVLLYYFAFKYRGRKDRKALYFADNNKLEALWSVIPAIILAGLILYGLYAWTNIMFIDEEDDAIVVELYGQQFYWAARVSGEDNVLGKANVRYIEELIFWGLIWLILMRKMILLLKNCIFKGKKIHFKMRSQDVLHSAYMP
jgi:cytochrome c oxidase subunit 2